jgi:hypothetical protein
MKKTQLALIASVAIGMVVGPGAASAATVFIDDFDDLSQWNAPHGGGVAGVDSETGSRTVFGRDGTVSTIPAAEIQTPFLGPISLTDASLQTITLDTVLRVNSPLNNLIIELRNENTGGGIKPGDFHRLYSSVNGVGQLEAREYFFGDTEAVNNDGPPSPSFPQNDLDSDYFTHRMEFDVPSATWTISTDHSGSMTVHSSWTAFTTVGEVDRIRLRMAGAGSQNFAASRYFVDSTHLYTTPIPEPVTLGLLGIGGLLIAGLRRRRG